MTPWRDRRTAYDLETWTTATATARAERASWLLTVLSLVPPEDQAEAMRCVLEVERVDSMLARTLETVWSQATARAYLDGQAAQARETVEAITGEASPTDPTSSVH